MLRTIAITRLEASLSWKPDPEIWRLVAFYGINATAFSSEPGWIRCFLLPWPKFPLIANSIKNGKRRQKWSFLAFSSPIVEDGSVSEKLKIEIRSILLIEQNDWLAEIPTIVY